MCAQLVLSAEERVVDPILGYPLGYAKLCRNAHKQMKGLITPFVDGPPQRFLPYVLQDDEILKVKEMNACFPMVPESERDSPNARRHADVLWQQLDHLENAGFDPAKFRVDPFGNVVYRHADPGSPLLWEIDHWFPHSRGGKTVVTNLRIVQWQVNQRKKEKLEFLLPWWDLQLGISVNQFLSAFSSKNLDFRNRCLAYMFLPGEGEEHKDSHSWPGEFRCYKSQHGLAAAALVKLQKEPEDFLCSVGFKVLPQCATPGSTTRRRWNTEEEEALRRAVQRFGPGSWKEIKESEAALANRSTVQIKDKYRIMKGDWNLDKENVAFEKQCSVAAALQKEMQLKLIREEEKRKREAEIAQLEQNLKEIIEMNAREYEALEDLEAILNGHRHEVEKQRRLAETQSAYRLCLERMIRDTLHEAAVYKEQARLSQVACNVLMAKLETHSATRQVAEQDLLTKFKQRREVMEMLSGAPAPLVVWKSTDLVDVSSCLSQPMDIQSMLLDNNRFETIPEDKPITEQLVLDQEEDQHGNRLVKPDETSVEGDGITEPELDVVVMGYEYEKQAKENKDANVSDNRVKAVGEGNGSEAGKMKVDKWLSMLLNNETKASEEIAMEDCGSPSKDSTGNQERNSKGIWSGLLKKLSLKQQMERTMRISASVKKTDSETEPTSKEWEELADEMGTIAISAEAGQVEEMDNEANEEAGKVEQVDNEALSSASTASFDDATSNSPVPTEVLQAQAPTVLIQSNSRKGPSLLKSLHDEEDIPLETNNNNNNRPWYLQDWNARVQARTSVKNSLKLCSQTWSKAMKKLDASTN